MIDSRMSLLRDAIEAQGSQAKVSKMLGYSTATISQVISNSYPGALEKVLNRVEEVFGSRTVDCPIRGKIALNECVEARRASFSNANPTLLQLFQTCPRCGFNTDNNDD